MVFSLAVSLGALYSKYAFTAPVKSNFHPLESAMLPQQKRNLNPPCMKQEELLILPLLLFFFVHTFSFFVYQIHFNKKLI